MAQIPHEIKTQIPDQRQEGVKLSSKDGVSWEITPDELARMREFIAQRIWRKHKNALRNVHGESDYLDRVQRYAREGNFSSEEFLAYIRQFAKQEAGFSEDTRFYHRTSPNNFEKIVAARALLSRENRRKQGEDISQLPWSSSSNVQFTSDVVSRGGQVVQKGLAGKVGNTNSGVTIVFGRGLVDEESFDCNPNYPTVERVSLLKAKFILGETDEDIARIQEALKNSGLYGGESRFTVMRKDEYVEQWYSDS